jgi:hypothetical protein
VTTVAVASAKTVRVTATAPNGAAHADLAILPVLGSVSFGATSVKNGSATTSADASLTVLAARMSSLTFPTGALIDWGDGQVSHDGHVTGTVALDAPAPEGTLVYLSASDSIVAIPVSAAVPAGGGNKATFTLTPAVAVASTAVIVSASLSQELSSAKTATVTLKPALLSLTLTPPSPPAPWPR